MSAWGLNADEDDDDGNDDDDEEEDEDEDKDVDEIGGWDGSEAARARNWWADAAAAYV